MLTSLVDPPHDRPRLSLCSGYGPSTACRCQHLGRFAVTPGVISFPPDRRTAPTQNQRSPIIRHRPAYVVFTGTATTPLAPPKAAATQHPFPPTSFRADQSERLAIVAAINDRVSRTERLGKTLWADQSGLGNDATQLTAWVNRNRGGSDQWTSGHAFLGRSDVQPA